MASFVSGDFNIPEGYVVEEIDGQLCHEDLDEDSELWLIRVPTDIQVSNLDKKRIYLGSKPHDVNVKTIKTENGKILDCCAENCDIPNKCVVLPEKNGQKLQAVCKVFKGAILISEGLNDDTEVKSEIDDKPPTAAVDDTPDFTHEPKRKKKKKKRDSHNTGYETEDANNTGFSVTKHRRSKKHKEVNNLHNESAEIKTELESMDSNGFPPCISQN